ncbi:hypothetical protein AKJ16_DCAP24319, partial [Drosera capensis]
MAEIDAPSFSLGLDLDLDPDPDPTTSDCFVAEDSDPEHQQEASRAALRRLCRGPRNGGKRGIDGGDCGGKSLVDEDDIEEFSDEDDCAEPGGIHQHSLSSSSKLSLRGCAILTRQAEVSTSGTKRKQTSSTHASFDASREHVKFPKSAVSPVRRFQLIDSDSDDSSDVAYISRNEKPVAVSKLRSHGKGQSKSACEPSAHVLQPRDPWESFQSEIPSVPTPALDSFCESYIRNDHGKNIAVAPVHRSCPSKLKSINGETEKGKQIESEYNLPPAHRYFFHEEARIRELVRSCLPHFFPLAAVNNAGFQQQDESTIDYKSQFSHGKGPKQQGNAKVTPKNTGKACKGSKKSNVEDISNPSGNWVDPRHQSAPSDAGRRRIQANAQNSGHWITGENGKKVYVSKNGKQLSGKIAYIQYRKDTGAGCRGSRKKTGQPTVMAWSYTCFLLPGMDILRLELELGVFNWSLSRRCTKKTMFPTDCGRYAHFCSSSCLLETEWLILERWRRYG